jgi:hypothetical protein
MKAGKIIKIGTQGLLLHPGWKSKLLQICGVNY